MAEDLDMGVDDGSMHGAHRHRQRPTDRHAPYSRSQNRVLVRSNGKAAAPARDRRPVDSSNQIKVSEKSNAGTVAGAIAQRARESAPPTVLCTGDVSVNQAIKSMIRARQYLVEKKDNMDLLCEVAFQNDESKGSFSIHTSLVSVQDVAHTSEIIVKDKSEYSKVAGAIAGRIREDEVPLISTKGAKGVYNSLQALVLANNYLQKDNISLAFQPEFTTIEEDGQSSTAIAFIAMRKD